METEAIRSLIFGKFRMRLMAGMEWMVGGDGNDC
jgi:hypothetical protein